MSDRNFSRRSVVGSLAGFGALSMAGTRAVRAQPTEKDRPDRYGRQGVQGDSLEAPAYSRHRLDTVGGRTSVRMNEYPIYDESASILGDAFWAPDVE